MKAMLAGIMLVLISSIGYGQTESLTGKWTVIKVGDAKTGEIDLRDTAAAHRTFIEKARADDKDFTEQDSMMVVFASKFLVEMFSGATIEFRDDKTYEFTSQASLGGRKKAPETGTYSIDASAKKITMTTKRRENVQLFDTKGGLLYLTVIKEDGSKDLTMVLEKVK